VAQLDVARLEALGFFRHVHPADLERVRQKLKEASSPFAAFDSIAPGGGETRRVYDADAEALAEREVLRVLGRVAPFLRREGVAIDVTYAEVIVPAAGLRPRSKGVARLDADGWLDEAGPDPYVESICVSFAPSTEPVPITEDDDRSVLIVGEREIPICGGDADSHDVWGQAVHATLALLNELLAAHGSSERAYAIYFGTNNLIIVFATPEMARVINAAGDEPRDRLHDGAGAYVS
jgi:hypothetical protein